MDLVENGILNKTQNIHPWELVRLGVIASNVAKIAEDISIPVSLIDIGCGDAFVISNLQKQFKFESFHAVDINFTSTQIDQLKKEYPKIDFHSDLKEVEISPKRAYILLLNDVIEHIEADHDFIDFLKATVIDKCENVSLFITVPAFQFVFSSHDIDLGHYRRYTLGQVLKYNDALKMQITSKGYFFTSLLMVRFLQRIISFKKPEASKGNIGIAGWNHGKVVTNVFILILKTDLFFTRSLALVGIKIPGLSTFAVFRKK